MDAFCPWKCVRCNNNNNNNSRHNSNRVMMHVCPKSDREEAHLKLFCFSGTDVGALPTPWKKKKKEEEEADEVAAAWPWPGTPGPKARGRPWPSPRRLAGLLGC